MYIYFLQPYSYTKSHNYKITLMRNMIIYQKARKSRSVNCLMQKPWRLICVKHFKNLQTLDLQSFLFGQHFTKVILVGCLMIYIVNLKLNTD